MTYFAIYWYFWTKFCAVLDELYRLMSIYFWQKKRIFGRDAQFYPEKFGAWFILPKLYVAFLWGNADFARLCAPAKRPVKPECPVCTGLSHIKLFIYP